MKMTRFLKVPSEIKKRDLERVRDVLREEVEPGQCLPINGGCYINKWEQVRSVYSIEYLLKDIPSYEAFLVEGNPLKLGEKVLMFAKDDCKKKYEYTEVFVHQIGCNVSALGGFIILGTISNRDCQIYIYSPNIIKENLG